jgi:hypothetical protein
VRPATLKGTAFVGAPVKGSWKSSLQVSAPQPRAALAASWKIPVGTKIKVGAPNLDAAAKARANVKLEAPKMNAPKTDASGAVGAAAKINGKLDIKAPVVAAPSIDVKGKAGAAANAGANVKTQVDGAVKANADVKVKAPVKPPSVKVDAKVKASGGFKLGN